MTGESLDTRGSGEKAIMDMKIGLKNKTIKSKNIHAILTPPKELQGRMGGVRIKHAHFDIAPIGVYFPPKTHLVAERTRYTATVDKICKELDKWLCSLPARCIPIIGTDLNDLLIKWPTSPDSGGIEIANRDEKYAANKFHTILAKHRLSAVNTMVGLAEHTYVGLHNTSLIDYVCMPSDSLIRVHTCKVLHKAGHELCPFQKVYKFMDHKPILTQ